MFCFKKSHSFQLNELQGGCFKLSEKLTDANERWEQEIIHSRPSLALLQLRIKECKERGYSVVEVHCDQEVFQHLHEITAEGESRKKDTCYLKGIGDIRFKKNLIGWCGVEEEK